MTIDNFLEQYIHGDKFIPIANFLITENQKKFVPEMLQQNCCIMCHTHLIKELFDFIKHSNKKYIIVSHNSDNNINEQLYAFKPLNVILWYAQNVTINKPNLIPIPVGIERPKCGWSWDMNLIQQEFMQLQTYENLVYMNHSDSTNFPERSPITQTLRNKPWVTSETEKVPFVPYLKRLHAHKFVISPPGNGADCHRTWEALYMQTIPIVKSLPFNVEFGKYLPILVVDNLCALTEEFLWEKYYEIKQNIADNKYNFDLLKISYWHDIINNSKKLI